MKSRLGSCLLVALCAAAFPALAESELDPIVMNTSTECRGAFADYQRRFEPLYFARALDGATCAYSYCESSCNRTNAREKTLYACSRAAEGIACQITAFAGELVEVEADGQEP